MPESSALAVVVITRSSDDAVALQLGGVDLDLDLLEALAPDRDVGHAGHAQQPRPDLPVRDHRQVLQAHRLRRHADLHDPAGRGDRRHHERRRRPCRQRRQHRLHALGDELAGLEDVGAPLEDQLDVESCGTDVERIVVQPGDAVQRVLERDA